MASDITHAPGHKSTTSATVTANSSGSSTPRYVRGPANDPTLYGGKVEGRYIKETNTGSVYRWIEDINVGASGTPITAGYTAGEI